MKRSLYKIAQGTICKIVLQSRLDEERVFSAAGYKMKYSISYADAFAAAAAAELEATLVTGDPELLALAGQVQLEPLHRSSKNRI